MACEIDLEIDASATRLLAKAREAMTALGGTMSGNEEEGTFHIEHAMGRVKGTYRLDGRRVRLVIVEKPIWASCGMIQARLAALLESQREPESPRRDEV